MKKIIFALTVFAAILTLLSATLTSFSAYAATVPEGHVGVVLHMGKAKDEVLGPGFYILGPINHLVNMDCRWQKYTINTSAFSKDIQQVDIQASFSYALSKDGALRMYKTVGVDYPDKIMMPRFLDALKATFAKYSAEELISDREQIAYEVSETLERQLAIYDLAVKEVAIEDIDFTDSFTDAIEAKQVATQKKLQTETEQEQQTIIAKAEAERKRIEAETAAEQLRIKSKAENETAAEKIRVKAEAEAEAVRIKADAEAYRLELESKHITEQTLEKQKLEKWDGKLPVISGGATPIVNASELIPNAQ